MADTDDRDRRAVIWHLEQQLAAIVSGRRLYQSELGKSADRLAAKAVLAARLKLISDEERDLWIERAQRAVADRPSGASSRTPRRRATAHLQRLQRKAAKAEPGPRSGERQAAFGGAVLVYELIGLLTRNQAQTWANRLTIKSPPPGKRPRDLHFAGIGEPRRTIGPHRRVLGLRVLTAALYDDGVVFEWHWEPTLASRQLPHTIPDSFDLGPKSPLETAVLSDDRGTRYYADSASWDHVGPALRPTLIGQACYAGRTPPDVKRLKLTIGPEQLTIPVTSAARPAPVNTAPHPAGTRFLFASYRVRPVKQA